MQKTCIKQLEIGKLHYARVKNSFIKRKIVKFLIYLNNIVHKLIKKVHRVNRVTRST